MSRRKSRQLNRDEEELWRRVARTTRPIERNGARKAIGTHLDTRAAVEKSERQEFELKPFQIGSRSTTLLSEVGLSPAADVQTKSPTSLDRGVHQKMRRGKAKPEARIDLHGMTVDSALTALTSFLFQAHGSGKRLVLVITGKGRLGEDEGPIPTRTGVLRQSLPGWVARPPLHSIVQQVVEAHQKHGGSGAFYVYLRRNR